MKHGIKICLYGILISLLFSCTKNPFTAEFELFNDGIVEDSLLQISVRIENTTHKNQDLDIEWKITTDNGERVKQMQFTYTLVADSILIAYPSLHHFQNCGFYRIEAIITSGEHSTQLYTNIVMNPEDISSPLRKPEDFDIFWKNNLKQVNELSSVPELKLIEQNPNPKTNLYEVSLKSIDNLIIKGWLEVPKQKGNYATLYRVPGYTETLEPLHRYSDMIVFSLNVRDHGNSENSGVRDYEMWVRGLESEEKFFYKNIYLDCFVGLNYLTSRGDVDINRIAIWGGSQGGGLSIFTAAFDKRITLCIADIPFLTDWERYFEISHWFEIDKWMSQHPNVSWDEILDVLAYFDTKNMVHKIECPVWMGIGLQDDVCPPATSFATYNLIKAPKRYNIYPHQFHSQPQHHYDKRYEELRIFFSLK